MTPGHHVPRIRDFKIFRRSVAACLVLLSCGLGIKAAWSQQAAETIRLKDGKTVEGVVLKTDLNIMVLRRAIGGVQLLPNEAIAELRLDDQSGNAVVFQFDNWIDGAASFELGGNVVAIEDWQEPEADQTEVAAAPVDDGTPPALSANVSAGEEGVSDARVRLKLSKPASTAIQLAYATSDGTAKAGADYDAVAGVVTFEAGAQVSELEIPVLDDQQAEDVEFLKLIVNADPALVSLDSIDRILAIIRDND